MNKNLPVHETIDLFQESLNNMVRNYHSVQGNKKSSYTYSEKLRNPKLLNFSYATFSINEVFKLNVSLMDEMVTKFNDVKDIKNIKINCKADQKLSLFERLDGGAKYLVIDFVCREFNLNVFSDKIECMALGNTCEECINKEFTRQEQDCDWCPQDVDIIEIDKKKFETIFQKHLSHSIRYDFCDLKKEEF